MAVTPNYSWPVPVATDFVKDGWEAISDLGNAIDTTVGGLGSPGLVLITTQLPSTSSGVVFTGLTVGKKYRLTGNLISSATAGFYGFRFRENTTDKSTGYYGGAYQVSYNNASGINAAYNNAAQADLGSNTSSYNSNFFLDLSVISLTTGIVNGLIWDGYNWRSIYTNFANWGMSNFNGISIYPNTGTFTGAIKLYEYE
jgi:hypothetical protein